VGADKKHRKVLFYKNFFQDFFGKQNKKVKEKIIWTLELIEDLDRVPETYLKHITPVQNKFLTALAKIGPTSYLPFSKTKPKAYVKNNSTCPNDSTVASRKV
jgi:hypothetical protein